VLTQFSGFDPVWRLYGGAERGDYHYAMYAAADKYLLKAGFDYSNSRFITALDIYLEPVRSDRSVMLITCFRHQ
jgi:hypothetical protein